jgi:hypothetical protein
MDMVAMLTRKITRLHASNIHATRPGFPPEARVAYTTEWFNAEFYGRGMKRLARFRTALMRASAPLHQYQFPRCGGYPTGFNSNLSAPGNPPVLTVPVRVRTVLVRRRDGR